MPSLAGGNFFNSSVFTATTAGTQIAYVGAAAATAVPGTSAEGKLHTITVGGDSTAETITVYDGTSTSGTVKFKGITTTSGQPTTWILDIQFNVGLFIVISGGTTVAVTDTWA